LVAATVRTYGIPTQSPLTNVAVSVAGAVCVTGELHPDGMVPLKPEAKLAATVKERIA
jgi:hypothetical protein